MRVRRPAVPRFWFSLRSPYSWLAHHDLVTHHPDVAEAVRWRPFFEPDETSAGLLHAAGGSFPYVAMSKEKHRYILQDVRRLAAARGLEFSWPVDRAPCWEVAHLAYLVAERTGAGRAFIAGVHRARWGQGLDISERSTIAAVAAEVGVDPALAAGAADDPELRAAGVQCLLDLQRDGVFGVPFGVLGHDRYWGVDRLDGFVAAVRGAWPDPPAPGPAAPDPGHLAAADSGPAGGCG